MKKSIFLVMAMVLLSISALKAQSNGSNPVSYSNLALQYSAINANGDARAGVLPSVAYANGFGSYLENPASMALMNDSYVNFGLFNNYTERENTYLGIPINTDKNETDLGNIGIVYSIPTYVGSLVIGGGYNLHTSQNYKVALNARNDASTITDYFKDDASGYSDIAFNTYAIDYGDVEQTYLESIFRIGFDPAEYPGITQDAEITQTTRLGEFSIFVATEFQKNLYVGFSLGLTSGTQSYRRNFLEIDEFNNYDGNFIEPDENGENGTDVDNILTHDEIDSDIYGFNFRAGAVYSITPNINIGGSIFLPGKLYVTEKFYSSIETEFDDGRDSFFDDFWGDFKYSIERPVHYSIGAALVDMNGFSISGSAEMIDYSTTKIDLTRDSDLSYTEIRDLREEESIINNAYKSNYELVTNLKAGAKYTFMNGVEVSGGYAWLPGINKNYKVDKSVYSGALSVPLGSGVTVDVSAQYSEWDDRSTIYNYYDYNGVYKEEGLEESIKQINMLFGFKIDF